MTAGFKYLPEPLNFEPFSISRVSLSKGAGSVYCECENHMCDRCAELDEKIEQFRKLASGISDRLTIEGIADRIKAMEAQKAQLHPEQKR
jgi:hypothetical protein